MSEPAWITMWVLLTFLVFLPTIIFIFMCVVYNMAFTKSKSGKFNFPFMDVSFYLNSPIMALGKKGIEYMKAHEEERIQIKSFDGLNLVGYYFPCPNGDHKKILIGMHGFKSNPFSEFGPYIEFYHSYGYDLLCPFERAHGESDGKYITMGVKERLDVVSWTNYAVDRFGDDIEILLHGVSMGAASVSSASGSGIPCQVKGIISDCAFSSVFDELRFQIKNSFHLPQCFVYVCGLLTKMIGKYDYKKNSAIDLVKQSRVPILFIHGAKDQIVPVECSKKLYDACSSIKRLLIIDEANHAECYGIDTDKYEKEIIEFFDFKK